MKTFFPILMLALSIVLIQGCTLFDPDLKSARELEGTWNSKSFLINGVETIGSLFTSFEMEFDKYDKGNGEGDFTFTGIFTDGSTDIVTGEYKVDDDGTNLELTYSDGGDVENWDLDIEKDDLELTAVIDGFNYKIEAERD